MKTKATVLADLKATVKEKDQLIIAQDDTMRKLKKANENLQAIQAEVQDDLLFTRVDKIGAQVDRMFDSIGETYTEISGGKRYTRSKSRQIGYELNGAVKAAIKLNRSLFG